MRAVGTCIEALARGCIAVSGEEAGPSLDSAVTIGRWIMCITSALRSSTWVEVRINTEVFLEDVWNISRHCRVTRGYLLDRA